MKYFVYFLFFAVASNLFSQTYSQPESVVYDAKRNCYYVSNVGVGGVWDGKIITRKSDETLEYLLSYDFLDPKGICIVGDTLYVADVNNLYFINLNTRHIAGSIELGNADIFLNDIEADNNGYIYVSETFKAKVYRLNTKDLSTFQMLDFIGQVASPNGLYFDEENNRMLMVTYHQSANIMAIDLETFQLIYIKTTDINFADGITRDKQGNYYISSWGMNNNGSIHKFDNNFDNQVSFASGFSGPADIYLDTINNVLAIPIMGTSEVRFLSLNNSINPPTLASPVNNSIGLGKLVTFKWIPVFGASTYTLQLSDDASFNNIIQEITTEDTVVSINAPVNSTKYYWRVKTNGLISSSDWSVVWAFTTPNNMYALPNLLLPKDGELYANRKPTFTWSKVNAGLYHFQLWENNKFEGKPIVEIKNMTDTTFALTANLTMSQTYYWRVMAFSGYVNSGWSELNTFKVDNYVPDAPVLIYPANGEEEIFWSVYLKWTNSNSALYRLQVSSYSDFSELVYDISEISDTTYLLSFPHNQIFYWKVRAYSGNFGRWSDVFSFKTLPDLSVRYEDQDEVEISPNPAKDNLNIKNKVKYIQNIRIFDLNGKEVLKISNLNTNNFNIDISKLHSGDYLILIDSEDKTVVGKFLISR